jgi:hypothetical protein
MDEERIAHIEHLKRVVIGGGGIWCGVQETIPGAGHDLVLFNSELSKTTLALADDEFFTVNSVHDKILQSDSTFKKARSQPANINIVYNENEIDAIWELEKHTLTLKVKK